MYDEEEYYSYTILNNVKQTYYNQRGIKNTVKCVFDP